MDSLDILVINYELIDSFEMQGKKITTVVSFMIENEAEADTYLIDLLAKPEYRSLNEINLRAQNLVKDENLKRYFINNGKEILKTYGHEI